MRAPFCHPEERSDEGSRACASARRGEYTRMARRVVAPYETAASLPKVRAEWASPIPGWHLAPSCCNSGWVATVLRDNAFTRAARPEGKGVDSQEGENRRCSPSCAQCGRAGRNPARDARAQALRLTRRIRTRTREILRRCAPQDDKKAFAILCHSERNEVQRRIPRLRVTTPTPPAPPILPPLKGEPGWRPPLRDRKNPAALQGGHHRS